MENFVDLIVNYWWVVLITIGLIVALLAKKISHAFGGAVIEIKAEEAAQLLADKKAVILDIQEKRIFEKEHIPDTVNIPGISFVDGSVDLKDTSMPVIIIPMKGITPMPVLQYLESAGVPMIYILKGGINEWREAGFPTTAS
jgi:rhodanese-related sulfurtransferase